MEQTKIQENTNKRLKDMDLTNYIPKGDLEGIDIPVIKQMLIEQVAQGNKEDVTVFENRCWADKKEGGFDWNKTNLDWDKILIYDDFTDFYKMYPNYRTLLHD